MRRILLSRQWCRPLKFEMTKKYNHAWMHVDTIGYYSFPCAPLSQSTTQPWAPLTVIGLAQAWALQEGNTLRALGTYVITRCSRTTVGRQGHDVMAGYGSIIYYIINYLWIVKYSSIDRYMDQVNYGLMMGIFLFEHFLASLFLVARFGVTYTVLELAVVSFLRPFTFV